MRERTAAAEVAGMPSRKSDENARRAGSVKVIFNIWHIFDTTEVCEKYSDIFFYPVCMV
jgi:hypothetical protein